MKDILIGMHVLGTTPEMLEQIVLAERFGVECAWLTSGGVAPDPLVVLAVAATKTDHILLGTSIVPTFPRHPLALVQQAIAVDQLAPGRLRLGVGPSHKPVIESMYGIPFAKPQEHLREYLKVLRAALYEGVVDFDGGRLVAHASLGCLTGVKVLASALRAQGFQLCGELSDGAISWMCPMSYLRDTALPALREGALSARRDVPPLIAHVPVVVSEDAAAVRAAAREQVGVYPTLPYYSQMLQDAGFPEAAEGTLSDRMIDALVVHGSAAAVKERLRGYAAFGIDEILAMLIAPKSDAQAFERTARALGELARE